MNVSAKCDAQFKQQSSVIKTIFSSRKTSNKIYLFAYSYWFKTEKSSLTDQRTEHEENTGEHPGLDSSQSWAEIISTLDFTNSGSHPPPLVCWWWRCWRCWRGRGREWRGAPSCRGWCRAGPQNWSTTQQQTTLQNEVNVRILDILICFTGRKVVGYQVVRHVPAT